MSDLNLASDGLYECMYPDYVEEFRDACTDMIEEYKDALEVGKTTTVNLNNGASLELQLINPVTAPSSAIPGRAQVKIFSVLEFQIDIRFGLNEAGDWEIDTLYFMGPNGERDPSECSEFWSTLDAFEIEWD